MKKKSILIILALALITNYSYSQNDIKIGLSGSIQGSQFGIIMPIWLGEKIVIAPALEIKYVEAVGTDIGFGIAPRFYIKKNTVSPYLGLKVGAFMNMPASNSVIENKKTIDYLFGGAFGGEYFILEHLSFGVEIQGNVTKSDENSNRFGNPDNISFNTATMISATIYF